MGASRSKPRGLGAHSTARDVVLHFAELERRSADTLLAGAVAVVTGGNSGIGLETAKALASAGCRVVVGSRSASGAATVQNELAHPGLGGYTVPRGAELVTVRPLDLTDLSSVRAFAASLASERRLDFVVLNAGVFAIPKLERTSNGWELNIATNTFGHAYLVDLLRPRLVAQGAPARLVILTSALHYGLDVSDLHFHKRPYSKWKAYGQSKLANILLAKQLADELEGTRITALSLHPGEVNTNIKRHMTTGCDAFLAAAFNALLADKSIPQGAATTVTACLDPSLAAPEARGAYLTDCHVAALSAVATDKDKALRRALWATMQAQLQEAVRGSTGESAGASGVK
jgi:NAD(P)-dependent dehydrogenase (short-subunit alcohol dehydrogenase family)